MTPLIGRNSHSKSPIVLFPQNRKGGGTCEDRQASRTRGWNLRTSKGRDWRKMTTPPVERINSLKGLTRNSKPKQGGDKLLVREGTQEETSTASIRIARLKIERTKRHKPGNYALFNEEQG